MPRRSVLQIAFHGVLLIVIGMLVGLAFANAIVSHAGEDVVRAWRVAHTSLLGAGTLYLAIAAIAHHLVLSDRVAGFVTGSFVLSAYAFAFCFVVAPALGARGLEPTGPASNLLTFALFGVSLTALLVSLLAVMRGLIVAARRA